MHATHATRRDSSLTARLPSGLLKIDGMHLEGVKQPPQACRGQVFVRTRYPCLLQIGLP
jgi:hypothetical protein